MDDLSEKTKLVQKNLDAAKKELQRALARANSQLGGEGAGEGNATGTASTDTPAPASPAWDSDAMLDKLWDAAPCGLGRDEEVNVQRRAKLIASLETAASQDVEL